MSLKPCKDPEFLNRVVNHPEVSKWMCGLSPPFDLSEPLARPSTVFLANEYGGFLFIADGTSYEVHTQFLPEGRGNSLKLAQEAAWHMFTKTNATEIRTYVPHDNQAAFRLTKSMGFKPAGWKEVNGERCEVFVLTIKTWAMSLCQQQQ